MSGSQRTRAIGRSLTDRKCLALGNRFNRRYSLVSRAASDKRKGLGARRHRGAANVASSVLILDGTM